MLAVRSRIGGLHLSTGSSTSTSPDFMGLRAGFHVHYAEAALHIAPPVTSEQEQVMPNSSPSSDRLQVMAIAVAAAAMAAVVFVGHVMSSPADHVLGPDLVYASVVSVVGFGAIALWAVGRRR